jgi:hypothetical protein
VRRASREVGWNKYFEQFQEQFQTT